MTQPNRQVRFRDLVSLQNQMRLATANAVNTAVYRTHIATGRVTSILLIGATQDVVLTWGLPFPNMAYDVEIGYLDLAGQATITEVSRTGATITMRVQSSIASLALGATFMLFGHQQPS